MDKPQDETQKLIMSLVGQQMLVKMIDDTWADIRSNPDRWERLLVAMTDALASDLQERLKDFSVRHIVEGQIAAWVDEQLQSDPQWKQRLDDDIARNLDSRWDTAVSNAATSALNHAISAVRDKVVDSLRKMT